MIDINAAITPLEKKDLNKFWDYEQDSNPWPFCDRNGIHILSRVLRLLNMKGQPTPVRPPVALTTQLGKHCTGYAKVVFEFKAWELFHVVFPIGLWLHSHQSSCLHLTTAVGHYCHGKLCNLVRFFVRKADRSLSVIMQRGTNSFWSWCFSAEPPHIARLNIPNRFLTLFKHFQMSLRATPITAIMRRYASSSVSDIFYVHLDWPTI